VYLVQFCEADINRVLCPSYQGFRIYRETLSRFSCAASIIVAIGAIHNNLFLNIFILLITSLLDNVLNISHVVYYNM
ncbi:hypothetical protein ACT6QE_03950, partial [Staphylococcus aureus]